MIFLFDLDDTLVSHRGKVPRQTWHVLRRLQREGHVLGIVSNNILAPSVAASVGLTQYVPFHSILVQASPQETRSALVQRWLDVARPAQETAIHYFDDRTYQVDEINQATWGRAMMGHHVAAVHELHTIIKRCL